MHVRVKLCYPLTMRAISERLRDASYEGVIQIDYLYLLPALCGRYPWQCEIVRRQRVTVVRWLWVRHATNSVCRPSVKLMHSWFAPTVCEYWLAAKISILGSTIIFRLNITVREVRKSKGVPSSSQDPPTVDSIGRCSQTRRRQMTMTPTLPIFVYTTSYLMAK